MITKAEINEIRSLADKRNRDNLGLFLAEGAKLVSELMASEFNIRNIYATERGATSLSSHSDLIKIVSDREIERLSLLKSSSQILAIVEKPKNKVHTPNKDQLIIALDRVQDPGNLGTIIRLADWFGITDVICSTECADCYAPKVVQATMGAITRVKVHYTDLESYLRDYDGPIYGTYLEGDDIYNTQLSKGGVIVMGNEGKGISKEISSLISDQLYIPPFPRDLASGSESLNVAIATAIVCSEFRRR